MSQARWLSYAILLGALLIPGCAKPDRMEWFRDDKFGMFIHWGPVSLKGTEIGWSRGGKRNGRADEKTGEIPVDVYDNLYKEFNPTEFDANEWVGIAKAAGMKYLVFTTKHHDGFCEFDSKLTDYKITNSPFRRDVVAELAKACHENDIRLGFYYSPPDWHHPDYRTDSHSRYIEYMRGQVRELLSNYGKVDILWFDGLGGTAKDWGSDTLFPMIHKLQPDIVVNNRAGLPADYDTPEQRIGRFQTDRPWETCMTLGDQWAWKPDDRVKSLKQCIHVLVKTVGGDGNLLFNVGPMPTGEIEPRQVARLREIGDWMTRYGESIYGTRGGPFRPGPWGVSTRKGNTIYVHVLNWDGDTVALPRIAKKIVCSSVLTGGAADVRQSDAGIDIRIPADGRNEIDTIIALQLNGPAVEANPAKVSSGSLAHGRTATASNSAKGNPEYAARHAVDDDYTTCWIGDGGDKPNWLEVDLGQPMTVNRAILCESFDRVQEFELQRKEGDTWHSFAEGTTIGNKVTLDFEPVTARFVRLNIRKTSGAPEIVEFQLFGPRGGR